MKHEKDSKKYQILIVEDNPGDYALIEDYILERFAAPDISWAKNFMEAKSQLLNTETKNDLVLLDLTLPDKSGEELITELIPLCHDMPLIVLTGYSDVAFGTKSLSLGVSDYLIKDELTEDSLYKGILYNIERKKTQIQLEISERRYSDLFHLSPLPMWVYDVATLRFLDVNAAAEKHYGYSLQEFLGMTILDIRPKEDIPMVLEQIKKLKDGEFKKGTYRHLKKNGEIIYVDIQSNTIRYQDSMGRIILAKDITERFTYIEAIERQNEKLKEIAWIQSHVVRAPLARLMGLIYTIKNEGYDGKDNEKLYDFLLLSAEELDNVIKDISKKSEQITLEIQKEQD